MKPRHSAAISVCHASAHAGKTTLFRCITRLEAPTSGTIVIDGVDIASLDARALRAARRKIGTIFQSAPLLKRRTVVENVIYPLESIGATANSAR
ncbi:MAG: ATP-binding cassette domain-containing protein, partial [Gordonia sp. (in: high G+C Gram-positive bacteria)]